MEYGVHLPLMPLTDRLLTLPQHHFPNALATMFLYITEDTSTAQRMVRDVLSPLLQRSASGLRPRLLVGSADACAETVAAYQAAGVRRLLVWPLGDELNQLTLFQERVASRVPA